MKKGKRKNRNKGIKKVIKIILLVLILVVAFYVYKGYSMYKVAIKKTSIESKILEIQSKTRLYQTRRITTKLYKCSYCS